MQTSCQVTGCRGRVCAAAVCGLHNNIPSIIEALRGRLRVGSSQFLRCIGSTIVHRQNLDFRGGSAPLCGCGRERASIKLPSAGMSVAAAELIRNDDDVPSGDAALCGRFGESAAATYRIHDIAAAGHDLDAERALVVHTIVVRPQALVVADGHSTRSVLT